MMKILKTLLIFFFSITIIQSQIHKTNKVNVLNKSSMGDSSSAKVKMQNSSGAVLIEINDEGDGGSISLPPLSAIGNSTNKLYSIDNILYWNDIRIGQNKLNSAWYLNNGNIVLEDSLNFIGIGTSTPSEKLHIEDGRLLVHGKTNWFPGVTIMNDIGRSVLNLSGRTNNENYSSSQIAMTDFTTGNVWNLLHSKDNEFIINSYDGISYESPFKVELGAPTNSFTVNKLGNIGIGTWSSEHKLAVAGSIISEEVVVKLQSEWPDYVFEEGYQLPKLNDVQSYINNNKHLKGIPSALEIKESGIDLAEMQIKLLEKIEELTLYIIQQDREIENLSEHVNVLAEILGDVK